MVLAIMWVICKIARALDCDDEGVFGITAGGDICFMCGNVFGVSTRI